MSPARKRTLLEMALLGLLAGGPKSGYDLRKVFLETPMRSYSESTGAVYPALRRLESRGLTSGRTDASTPLRPRKVYRLTAAGRRELEAWLRSPVTREMVERRQEELALRMAFADQILEPDAIVRFLVQWREHQAARNEELEGYTKLLRDKLSVAGQATLSLGIEIERLRLRWLTRTIRKLKE